MWISRMDLRAGGPPHVHPTGMLRTLLRSPVQGCAGHRALFVLCGGEGSGLVLSRGCQVYSSGALEVMPTIPFLSSVSTARPGQFA